MKKVLFPYLAVFMDVGLLMMVLVGMQPGAHDGLRVLPTLTLLIISEFAFFLSLAGIYQGIKQQAQAKNILLYRGVIVACVLFSAIFAWLGVHLWPF